MAREKKREAEGQTEIENPAGKNAIKINSMFLISTRRGPAFSRGWG